MERRQEELGIHILENIRNELYYYFPYLDGAFACISGKGSEQTGTIGTDGAFFLFSPEYLLKLYVKKPEAVRRGYLHMLLHCLYLHLFQEDQEDRRLWNLACDIAVEQIISREKIPILETGGDAKKIREKVFHILGDRSDSAEKICRKLKEQAFPFHLEELEEAYPIFQEAYEDYMSEYDHGPAFPIGGLGDGSIVFIDLESGRVRGCNCDYADLKEIAENFSSLLLDLVEQALELGKLCREL